MNDQVTATGVVHGKVQGVWYRAFVREQARLLGVTGYARNQPDGSVAFGLTGARTAVELILRALEEGPPLARVSHLDVSWQPAKEMHGFETG